MQIIDWLKRHKFSLLVLAIVGFVGFKSLFGISPLSFTSVSAPTYNKSISAGVASFDSSGIRLGGNEYAPQADVENRLVIEESSLSLLVKDVTDTRKKITDHAQSSGGYMVSSQLSNPQDAPAATVIVRVPSQKLDTALTYFRSLSIKIVSENLLGQDVTDQYMDIDSHLASLEKTKAKFESILNQASQVSDITNLTQQIISIQTQIDSLKGRQVALEKNSQLAKITLYLSTDEIALPYAPNETFRPAVVFKLAVRSLVSGLRAIATLLIWLAVYSVIWLPLIGIFIFIRNRMLKQSAKQPTKNL